MGLLDELVSGVLKGVLSGQGQSSLPGLLAQVLRQTDLGSIGGLLQQLQQGGLDRQVASWLGKGANMGITADQLRNALGDEQIQQIGRATGLPVDDILKMLAQHLPSTIDSMSPNGRLEDESAPEDDSADASPDEDAGNLQDQAGLRDIGRR